MKWCNLWGTRKITLCYTSAYLTRETEGYSVAYFDHIAVFQAPYRWTSIKGRAHMCFIAAWIHKVHMSPALNGSSESAKWRFQSSNMIELHDGITFWFLLHRTATYTNYYVKFWTMYFHQWEHFTTVELLVNTNWVSCLVNAIYLYILVVGTLIWSFESSNTIEL